MGGAAGIAKPALQLETKIRAAALEAGFDAVGIVSPESVAPRGADLKAFLVAGRHGDMKWMEVNAERRQDPRVLWPETRSVIAVAMNYGPAERSNTSLDTNGSALIAAYAQRRDYHDVMKSRLKRFGRWMVDALGAEIKVFVDTAPVLEKPLAEQAGLGWQGKHTNLVSRSFGSWLLLGEVFTTLELAPDIPGTDGCGDCERCLDACPTGAFPAPYQLDARRCISYLTIEHKGQIAAEYRSAIGTRVFGCDECLAVCPWNKYAQMGNEALLAREEFSALQLSDMAMLDDSSFREVFSGTAIKRTGRDRFVRNVLIAIGNSGQKGLAAIAVKLLSDSSPLVRAMSVWALVQLDVKTFERQRSIMRDSETNADVCAEWDAL